MFPLLTSLLPISFILRSRLVGVLYAKFPGILTDLCFGWSNADSVRFCILGLLEHPFRVWASPFYDKDMLSGLAG
jgi:hypothetical protein